MEGEKLGFLSSDSGGGGVRHSSTAAMIAHGRRGTHGQESNGIDGQLIEVGVGHDGGLGERERWMRRWTLGGDEVEEGRMEEWKRMDETLTSVLRLC